MAKGDSKRFTVEAVRKIKPPETGRTETYDAIVSGLFLRVTASGHKSWGLDYRVNGKRRRTMIGPWPSVEIDEARERAEDLKRHVRDGLDPSAEKRAAKQKAASPDTFTATVEDFLKRHASRNKSAKETERIFRVYVLPSWGGRALDEIKRRDRDPTPRQDRGQKRPGNGRSRLGAGAQAVQLVCRARSARLYPHRARHAAEQSEATPAGALAARGRDQGRVVGG